VLDEAFAIAPARSGPLLVAARFNFAIHRFWPTAENTSTRATAAPSPGRRSGGLAGAARGDRSAARPVRRRVRGAHGGRGGHARGPRTPSSRSIHAKTGNPAEAVALLEVTLAATRMKDPRRRAWLRLQLGIVAMERGELRVAQDHLRDADAELAGWWPRAGARRRGPTIVAATTTRRRRSTRSSFTTVDLPQHMDALAALYKHMGKPKEAEALIARGRREMGAAARAPPESAMGHALQHYLQFGTPERAPRDSRSPTYAARPGGDAQVSLAHAYLKAGRLPRRSPSRSEHSRRRTVRHGCTTVAAKAHAELGHTACRRGTDLSASRHQPVVLERRSRALSRDLPAVQDHGDAGGARVRPAPRHARRGGQQDPGRVVTPRARSPGAHALAGRGVTARRTRPRPGGRRAGSVYRGSLSATPAW